MITLDLNKNSGIVLDLKKESSSALNNVRVLLNWNEHPVHLGCKAKGFDLDLWAFVIDSTTHKPVGVVYYHDKNYNNGAIVLPFDNQNGSGDDDEEFNINLSKVPDNQEIHIYVFIHDAASRGQDFGMIAGANVQISNMDTNEQLVKYDMNSMGQGQTAIFVGVLNKTNFTPAGDLGVQGPADVLNFYQN